MKFTSHFRGLKGLSLLLMLSMLLAACGAPASTPAADSGATGDTTAAAGGESSGEFDWGMCQGESLNLLLNQHPYQQALVSELPAFEELTGMTVSYDVFPEQNYFDKVTIDLQAGNSGTYDAFMTGAYMIWQYAPAGWMEPLEGYISDPAKTNPDYNFEDILPDLRNSEMWNLEPGMQNLGQGSQYALPWGWEANAYMYRKDIFDANSLTPPTSLDELVEVSKQLKEINPDMAGIVVRGSLNWATIHPGFMTMYASNGCVDYDENMVPQMNSACAVEVTEKWIDMVRSAGPEAWTTYTWYQAGSDFGAGKAASMFDADILGYFQNQPDTAAAEVLGNVAWAPGPLGPDGELKTNIWIWSLAMNAGSQKKDCTWLFMQWATGEEFLTKGAVEYSMVNPVRQAIWENEDFQAKMAEQTDYLETFNTISSNNMQIQFTPQPLFFETTTEWAQALQDIYAGQDAQERLDKLVDSLTEQLQDAGITQ
ncbi:MAG: extracellular solute-binding protein [Caldilineaceae bacterium]|nr:extracellular solute-binding protein [Caldilineaceae bacterium]